MVRQKGNSFFLDAKISMRLRGYFIDIQYNHTSIILVFIKKSKFINKLPQKFANIHKIFGAINVAKILNDLELHQRGHTVNSLAQEAKALLNDPIYGCVGAISMLQSQVQQLQKELVVAHVDLLQYSSAMEPVLSPHSLASMMPAYSRVHMIHAAARKQQQRNLMEFPNSGEELQLNKVSLLELALRIMPMHYILQPSLPEMAVAVAVEGSFCISIFIFLFMAMFVWL